MVESLSSQLNIKTKCHVKSISYNGRLTRDDGSILIEEKGHNNGLVALETNSGEILSCRRVVVTSSVASLKSGIDITFHPGLPNYKLNILQEIKTISQIKVFIQFSNPPWPSKMEGIVMCGASIPEVSFRKIQPTENDTAVYYCVGVCNAAFAEQMKNASDEELIKTLLHELDMSLSLLTLDIDQESDGLPLPSKVFLRGMVSRWIDSTPCERSYAAHMVQREQAIALGNPIADKVFFAGEGIIPRNGPRLHDAMLSGQLCAEAVLHSLSSPSLSSALDRYFMSSGPCATVVGFGTLLAESTARATFPNLKNFRVVRVSGYRRVFGHSPSVMVERGMAVHGSLTQGCLSAEPVFLETADGRKVLDDRVGFLAVSFDVSMNDIADAVGGSVGVGGRMWCGHALMKREEEFNFDIVCCQRVIEKGEIDSQSTAGLMCVSSTDEEFRTRWGDNTYRQKLLKTGLSTIWGWDEKSALKPCPAYTNHCYLAAQSLGAQALDSFLDDTYLVDRKTSLRTYLSRNPDVHFAQPPSMHDSRHMTEIAKSPPRQKKEKRENKLPLPPCLSLSAADNLGGDDTDDKGISWGFIVGGTLALTSFIGLLLLHRHRRNSTL